MSAYPEISEKGNDIQTDDKNPEPQWLLLVHHNHPFALSVTLTVEPVKMNIHRHDLLISQPNREMGANPISTRHPVVQNPL